MNNNTKLKDNNTLFLQRLLGYWSVNIRKTYSKNINI